MNIQTTKPTDGQKLSIAGGTYRIIISGEQTNKEFAVIEMRVPPGGGPNPHAHNDFNESFYVAEGEVEFYNESGMFTAAKGAFVNIPTGGAVHNFKNVSQHNALLICTVMPSGLDEFFIEADALLKENPGPPNDETKQKLDALSKEYGQILYPPNYFDGEPDLINS